MPRMIDLVRKSQMSSNMMQAAARGALAVQSGEMLEILVHLALHNKVFAEQARMTLAGWDERASAGVAADPATSKEVLGYLVSPKNLRPALLPALLENPSVEQESLLELAATGARWVVEALLASESAKKSSALMSALQTNPRLRANELAAIENSNEAADISQSAAPEHPESAAAPASAGDSELHPGKPSGARGRSGQALRTRCRAGWGGNRGCSGSGAYAERRGRGGGSFSGAERGQAGSLGLGQASWWNRRQAGKEARNSARRGKAGQHAAEDRQARHQGTDRVGDEGQQGGALDPDPRRNETGGPGCARFAESFGRRSGEFRVAEKRAGGRPASNPAEAAFCEELRDRAQSGVQPTHTARSLARLDEEPVGSRLEEPVRKQGSFGYHPQAGAPDVQTEVGEEERLALSTE